LSAGARSATSSTTASSGRWTGHERGHDARMPGPPRRRRPTFASSRKL
jgi:hypothetical protein